MSDFYLYNNLQSTIIPSNSNSSIVRYADPHILNCLRGLSASEYIRTSALSISWNNIHIAVGWAVAPSAVFTSGNPPISANPSSPNIRRRFTRSYERT